MPADLSAADVPFVATLVCDPVHPLLDDALVGLAVEALGRPCQRLWLDDGIAADLSFEASPGLDRRAVATRIRTALGSAAIDVLVQGAGARRKRLLLADMDSTMIGQECIDELADFAGVKAEVAAITERAMRGEIAFEPALRERVAVLRGLPVGIVEQIVHDRLTLTPGGAALIRTMRAHGAHTCLVSGGFTLFTARIAERLGFAEHRANRLVLEGDVFSGQVEEPILGREAKRATLVELRMRLGLAGDQTMAVGDGANDLGMIEEAGLGVAFRAKPAVASVADAAVDHGDLTAFLYAQGYRRAEFVS